jgi:hypothetical protein
MAVHNLSSWTSSVLVEQIVGIIFSLFVVLLFDNLQLLCLLGLAYIADFSHHPPDFLQWLCESIDAIVFRSIDNRTLMSFETINPIDLDLLPMNSASFFDMVVCNLMAIENDAESYLL